MWKYKCGSLTLNVKYNISLYLLISPKNDNLCYLSTTLQFERQAFRCVILSVLKGSIRRSYPQVCVCVCGQVKVNGKVYFLTDLVGIACGRFKCIHFDRGTCALRRARDNSTHRSIIFQMLQSLILA